MDFSMDVFNQTPHSFQAHLRLEDELGERETPFALFNAHLPDPKGDGQAEGLMVIYEARECPPDELSDVIGKVHSLLHEHMNAHLASVDVLERIDPEGEPTPADDLPAGFAILRGAQTAGSCRYALQEANEDGPVREDVSALLDVFEVSPEQLAATFVVIDERLQDEQRGKHLFSWLAEQVGLKPRPQTNVEMIMARYLGRATPGHH